MSRRRLRICAGAVACVLAAVAFAAAPSAFAHPLGNFTINQLAQVRIDDRDAQVHYILDQAEIPTFQQLQRYDADGSGAIDTAPEESQVLQSLLGEISSGLALTANGRTVPLGAPEDPQLSFPPGQGGLSLTRVEVSFAARLPAQARHVELTNSAFTGHVGWDAIQILPGDRDRRPLERPGHRPHRRPARLPPEPAVEPAKRPRGELRGHARGRAR